MAYQRIFMPLTCEARGYEFKGRTPAGRCIIETHGHAGKLSVWAQDIKPETRYGIYMIFADGGRYAGVMIGSLPVDTKGRGEVRRDFGASELRGFAASAAVAVAIVPSDGVDLVSPLCGYKDMPVMWRGSFYMAAEPMDIAALKVEPPPVEPEPVELEPVEPEPMEPEPMEPEPVEPEPIEPEPMEPEPMESEPIEPEPMEPEPIEPEPVEPEPIEPEPAEPELVEVEPEEQEEPEQAEEGMKPWGEVCPAEPVTEQPTPPPATRPALETTEIPTEKTDNTDAINSIEAIIEDRPKVAPFAKLNRDAKWVHFAITDAIPMPQNRPRLLREPFVRAAYANHGHLLLGVTTDSGPKKYIIGVPSVYEPEQRHQAKRLGFSQFKCNKDERPQSGTSGYWLMFINL